MTAPKGNLIVLRRRAEFLAVAATRTKWVAPGFVMQIGAPRPSDTSLTTARYGLTATVKIGNAVVRNRARRRLRALAFEMLAPHADPGRDYVLIAREATATCSYDDLKREMEKGLKRLKLWRA